MKPSLLAPTFITLNTGSKKYQDNVYAKCRLRREGHTNFHYIHCLIDTGNQTRDTIISEELFYKISKDKKIVKEDANINGINESMHVLGRTY